MMKRKHQKNRMNFNNNSASGEQKNPSHFKHQSDLKLHKNTIVCENIQEDRLCGDSDLDSQDAAELTLSYDDA